MRIIFVSSASSPFRNCKYFKIDKDVFFVQTLTSYTVFIYRLGYLSELIGFTFTLLLISFCFAP